MTAAPDLQRDWAPAAWIAGGWQRSVVLEIDAQGHWSHIAAGVPAPHDAEKLAGPVLPGLVDAHSHAFQRAFAGLAESRTDDSDEEPHRSGHVERKAVRRRNRPALRQDFGEDD